MYDSMYVSYLKNSNSKKQRVGWWKGELLISGYFML